MNSKMDSENHLLKALPPKTDYLTYLTILEFNLTVDDLPLLHHILQDVSLTTNIGWDLVHILLPLLPDSSQCLNDVARLGNPREVILKVTELLEETSQDSEEDEAFESDDEAVEGEENTEPQLSRPSVEINLLNRKDATAMRFEALLQLLAILHARIKTKYPSRFLITSLEAILPAYRRLAPDTVATNAILDLLRTLTLKSKPPLPPRREPLATLIIDYIAPDPEIQDELAGLDEKEIQEKMIFAFISQIVQAYVDSLAGVQGSSGMAWADRAYESAHPERLVPHRVTLTALFREEESCRCRDEAVLRFLKFADSVARPSLSDLFRRILEAPSSEREASDDAISISTTGTLYLYAARGMADVPITKATQNPSLQAWDVFRTFLGDPKKDDGSIGEASSATIDAIVFLGSRGLEDHSSTIFEDHTFFHHYVQQISLVSANCPAPKLRYQAHILAIALLNENRSEQARLDYIFDTLQHCPYENLKTSSVGWLKDELLTHVLKTESASSQAARTIGAAPTPAQPWASMLDSMFPFLFPSPDSEPEPDSLHTDLPFLLATLNLLRLLCLSRPARTLLNVASLCWKHKVDIRFLQPLLAIGKQAISNTTSNLTPTAEAGVENEIEEHLRHELAILDNAAIQASAALQAVLNDSIS